MSIVFSSKKKLNKISKYIPQNSIGVRFFNVPHIQSQVIYKRPVK